jgi:hypothetical protein
MLGPARAGFSAYARDIAGRGRMRTDAASRTQNPVVREHRAGSSPTSGSQEVPAKIAKMQLTKERPRCSRRGCLLQPYCNRDEACDCQPRCHRSHASLHSFASLSTATRCCSGFSPVTLFSRASRALGADPTRSIVITANGNARNLLYLD